MTNSTPKIAIIGCGAITENYYLPALASSLDILANLILVDHEQGRLEKISVMHKVGREARDHHEVLDEADGAIIALPTGLHAPVALDFLSRGIPVLCEKPLAENAAQARRMVETANRCETTLAANYLQRLIPHFAHAKELIQTQTYGKLVSIEYVIGEIFNWPTVSGFYFKSDPSTRGVLRDRGAHAVDHICWWLGGKPNLVSSQNDSFGGSEAVARVEFERAGCEGSLTLSWFADVPCRFILRCEKAVIEGDIYDYRRLRIIEGGRARDVFLDSPIQSKGDVAQAIVDNFIRVIERGDAPLVSGENVLDSVAFTDECYERAVRFDMSWYSALEVEHVR